MNDHSTPRRFFKSFPWAGFVMLLAAPIVALCSMTAAAQPADWPTRVGRVAQVEGTVWLYDTERDEWTRAERNRALTAGDRVATDRDARAELRIGSTVLRLGPGAELALARLDDEAMQLQLASGSLAVRVQTRDLAEQLLVTTASGRTRPQRAGLYRFDRTADSTVIVVWSGELLFEGREAALPVGPGERIEVWRDGSRWERSTTSARSNDAFASWVLDADRREQTQLAAPRALSPELTGGEELDRYGRWDRHPEFGSVWMPAGVPPGWAPYRDGRWAWVRPWGWTWIDAAPWGFATSHYGRWVEWGGRWSWWPGAHALRPVFAPSLVVWAGSPRAGVSVSIGGPGVGWAPLPPRAVPVWPGYALPPHWRNEPPRHDPRRAGPPRHPAPPRYPNDLPGGPIMYGGQGVPTGVITVPRDVLVPRPAAPAEQREMGPHRQGTVIDQTPRSAPERVRESAERAREMPERDREGPQRQRETVEAPRRGPPPGAEMGPQRPQAPAPAVAPAVAPAAVPQAQPARAAPEAPREADDGRRRAQEQRPSRAMDATR